jgi:hypothetical protein
MVTSLGDRRPEIVLIDPHKSGAQERLCVVHPEMAVVAVDYRRIKAAHGHLQIGENVFGDDIVPVVQRLPQGVIAGVFGLGG